MRSPHHLLRRREALASLAGVVLSPAVGAQAAAAVPAAFDLQGHRGARGLAPENTLEGFAWALAIGVSTLELDVGITRDGVPVISHDRTLNPDITRGPDGQFLSSPGPAIHSLTFDELRRYDVGRIRPGTRYARDFAQQQPVDGARIPRLSELFELVERAGNRSVRLAIETKLSPLAPQETPEPEVFARTVIAAVRQAGLAQRTAIQSFDWRTLQVAQREAPELPTVYLTMQRSLDNIGSRFHPSPWTAGRQLHEYDGSIPRMVKAAGGHTWSCFHGDLAVERVKEAQALGLTVLAWTVNDPQRMAALMDWGVDGLITDRPDLLREVMQRRGMPLPLPTPVAVAK